MIARRMLRTDLRFTVFLYRSILFASDLNIILRKIKNFLDAQPEIAGDLVRQRQRSGVFARLDRGYGLARGAHRESKLVLREFTLPPELLYPGFQACPTSLRAKFALQN